MLDHSTWTYLEIRAVIILLQYTPLLEALLVGTLLAVRTTSSNPGGLLTYTIYGLAALLVLELVFYVTYHRPHKARLHAIADNPPPLSREDRAALWARCSANVLDWEHYLRMWFLDADMAEIKRDNVREFLLWAFFDRDSAHLHGGAGPTTPLLAAAPPTAADKDLELEVQSYVDKVETLLGRPIPPGRGSACAFRLTIDDVEIRYRSVVWYAIVSLVDFITHSYLAYVEGYSYYRHSPGPAPSTTTTTTTTNPTEPPHKSPLTVFPPRVQQALTHPFLPARRLHSASTEMGYWYRPHRSTTRLPVVFIHGIGIGLWPYTKFLGELDAATATDDDQVGVIALEVLSMSMRLTAPPLSQHDFVAHVTTILAQHGAAWDRFVLVSHSYGSVLTTHMLKAPAMAPRVRAVVLVDPVSVLLHLPDVAFNFTRRAPRTANEWQLWYFASMDMGVAEGLGRHFFWRENIIWKDELLTGGRKVVACLSGRDLIVDTQSVGRYLACEGDLKDERDKDRQAVIDETFDSRPGDVAATWRRCVGQDGLEVLWFPKLDHAQVFDSREHRRLVIDAILRCCQDGDSAS
ncbi:hypothetical protein B0T19DRAFT_297637 [Cercophora scortea]|uniref:AB hydrolase-1 domain-containing protein n=1 Tax=Cercophora scortea TaxID=314031 RepID=A0AAE0I398_9PEZI|nr:hypothetical protein B0T19DRAFT_297637 [Cercophora scortea]